MYFCNTAMLTNLVSISLLANNALFLKCYECGVGGNIEKCDTLTATNQYLYIKNCPSNSPNVSCSIHKNAKSEVLERTCVENIRLNSCAVANGIEYCYCTQDLCNNLFKEIDTALSDDEDFPEGSGTEENTTEVPLPKDRKINVLSSSARALYSVFLLLLCLISTI